MERLRESGELSAPPVSVSLSDPENYSFAVVGDLHILGGDTARTRKILTQAAAENDAFVIFLGDIVDKGDLSDVVAFRDVITELNWTGRAFPVLGNHDIFNDGWTHYRALNGPSRYTVDIGNLRLYVLDTADGTVGAMQREQLEAELASEGGPALRVLASHYLPMIPEQRTYLKLADDTEALRLMKLAAASHVKAWFGAHYHSYVTGTIEGVDYVCAGGGGGRRMQPVTEFFFVQVQVQKDQLTYHLRKID